MASVRLSRKAQADLLRIAAYYLDIADQETAAENIDQIRTDIQNIAENTMLGRKVENVDGAYYIWYTLGTRYKVYFKRLNSNSIRVLRIHPSRGNPLKPKDIFG